MKHVGFSFLIKHFFIFVILSILSSEITCATNNHKKEQNAKDDVKHGGGIASAVQAKHNKHHPPAKDAGHLLHQTQIFNNPGKSKKHFAQTINIKKQDQVKEYDNSETIAKLEQDEEILLNTEEQLVKEFSKEAVPEPKPAPVPEIKTKKLSHPPKGQLLEYDFSDNKPPTSHYQYPKRPKPLIVVQTHESSVRPPLTLPSVPPRTSIILLDELESAYRPYKSGYPLGFSLESYMPSDVSKILNKRPGQTWQEWFEIKWQSCVFKHAPDSCMWDKLNTVYKRVRHKHKLSKGQLFVAFTYFLCHKKRYNICPDPCIGNPCGVVSHSTGICFLAPPAILINDITCKCYSGYKWNTTRHQCVKYVDTICPPENPCDKFGTETCLQTMEGYICECIPSNMGPLCMKQRNACFVGHSHPPGNDMCGNSGVCIPLMGSDNYECDCDDDWADDQTSTWPNCKKPIGALALEYDEYSTMDTSMVPNVTVTVAEVVSTTIGKTSGKTSRHKKLYIFLALCIPLVLVLILIAVLCARRKRNNYQRVPPTEYGDDRSSTSSMKKSRRSAPNMPSKSEPSWKGYHYIRSTGSGRSIELSQSSLTGNGFERYLDTCNSEQPLKYLGPPQESSYTRSVGSGYSPAQPTYPSSLSNYPSSGKSSYPGGSQWHSSGSITNLGGSHSHPSGSITHSGGSYSHPCGSIINSGGSYSHPNGSTTNSGSTYSHPSGSITNSDGSHSHHSATTNTAGSSYSHPSGSISSSGSSASHYSGRSNKSRSGYSQPSSSATNSLGHHTYPGGRTAYSGCPLSPNASPRSTQCGTSFTSFPQDSSISNTRGYNINKAGLSHSSLRSNSPYGTDPYDYTGTMPGVPSRSSNGLMSVPSEKHASFDEENLLETESIIEDMRNNIASGQGSTISSSVNSFGISTTINSLPRNAPYTLRSDISYPLSQPGDILSQKPQRVTGYSIHVSVDPNGNDGHRFDPDQHKPSPDISSLGASAAAPSNSARSFEADHLVERGSSHASRDSQMFRQDPSKPISDKFSSGSHSRNIRPVDISGGISTAPISFEAEADHLVQWESSHASRDSQMFRQDPSKPISDKFSSHSRNVGPVDISGGISTAPRSFEADRLLERESSHDSRDSQMFRQDPSKHISDKSSSGSHSRNIGPVDISGGSFHSGYNTLSAPSSEISGSEEDKRKKSVAFDISLQSPKPDGLIKSFDDINDSSGYEQIEEVAKKLPTTVGGFISSYSTYLPTKESSKTGSILTDNYVPKSPSVSSTVSQKSALIPISIRSQFTRSANESEPDLSERSYSQPNRSNQWMDSDNSPIEHRIANQTDLNYSLGKTTTAPVAETGPSATKSLSGKSVESVSTQRSNLSSGSKRSSIQPDLNNSFQTVPYSRPTSISTVTNSDKISVNNMRQNYSQASSISQEDDTMSQMSSMSPKDKSAPASLKKINSSYSSAKQPLNLMASDFSTPVSSMYTEEIAYYSTGGQPQNITSKISTGSNRSATQKASQGGKEMEFLVYENIFYEDPCAQTAIRPSMITYQTDSKLMPITYNNSGNITSAYSYGDSSVNSAVNLNASSMTGRKSGNSKSRRESGSSVTSTSSRNQQQVSVVNDSRMKEDNLENSQINVVIPPLLLTETGGDAPGKAERSLNSPSRNTQHAKLDAPDAASSSSVRRDSGIRTHSQSDTAMASVSRRDMTVTGTNKYDSAAHASSERDGSYADPIDSAFVGRTAVDTESAGSARDSVVGWTSDDSAMKRDTPSIALASNTESFSSKSGRSVAGTSRKYSGFAFPPRKDVEHMPIAHTLSGRKDTVHKAIQILSTENTHDVSHSQNSTSTEEKMVPLTMKTESRDVASGPSPTPQKYQYTKFQQHDAIIEEEEPASVHELDFGTHNRKKSSLKSTTECGVDISAFQGVAVISSEPVLNAKSHSKSDFSLSDILAGETTGGFKRDNCVQSEPSITKVKNDFSQTGRVYSHEVAQHIKQPSVTITPSVLERNEKGISLSKAKFLQETRSGIRPMYIASDETGYLSGVTSSIHRPLYVSTLHHHIQPSITSYDMGGCVDIYQVHTPRFLAKGLDRVQSHQGFSTKPISHSVEKLSHSVEKIFQSPEKIRHRENHISLSKKPSLRSLRARSSLRSLPGQSSK